MQPIRIILLCIGAAIIYGVVHDLITAQICVEYFTIGHPPVFETDSPALLALGWGVIATWWVGLLIGVPLALVARVGARPKRSVGSLVRPVAVLLGVMALGAVVAGVVGWLLARRGAIGLLEPLSSSVPAEKHVA